MSYLCKMKLYLNTPTSELTTPHIRHIVDQVIQWSKENVGTKRKRQPLTYVVTRNNFCPFDAYGQYDPTPNVITISRSHCKNVKLIIRTVLHEYCHFLQDLRSYSKVLREVGYNKHPQEIEARVMETMYSICWNDIKKSL